MKRAFGIVVLLALLFSSVFSPLLSVTVSAQESSLIPAIPVQWDGEYDGTKDGTVVRRNLTIYINKVEDSGEIGGKVVISPSNKADSSYGVNGSYFFKGTINFKDFSISLQGYEWIDYPIGTYTANFSFVKLKGKIDLSAGTIVGTSDHGVWEMSSVISYEKYNHDSGFARGVDNNRFVHTANATDYANAGFQGVAGYPLSEEFYNSLKDEFSAIDMNYIKNKMNAPRGGNCYGIASTMGWLYNNLIDITDLTDSGANTYFDMPMPYQDTKLMDAINYFQITQDLLGAGGKWKNLVTIAYNNKTFKGLLNIALRTGEDSLSVCLRKIVNRIESNRVYLLGLYYMDGKESKGHAVLVVGSGYDETTNEYVLKIYDENTVKVFVDPLKISTPKGEFREMRIKSDFSGFRYENINETNFIELYLLDWGAVNEVSPAESDNTIDLTVSLEDSFTITNQSGQYLSYDGNTFSGNLPIYGISAESHGEGSSITFKTEFSNQFKATNLNESVDFKLFGKNGCLSVSGNGISEILFNTNPNKDEALKITGDEYSFKAFVGTNQLMDNGELGLVSVEATSSGNTIISEKDNSIMVKNTESLSDVLMSSYIGTKRYSILEKSVQELSLSADYDKHTLIEVKEVSVSCNQDGNKAHYKCEMCGRIFLDNEGKTEITNAEDLVINKKDHITGTWTIVTAAGIGSAGEKHLACVICGEVLETGTIDPLGFWGFVSSMTASQWFYFGRDVLLSIAAIIFIILVIITVVGKIKRRR